MTQRQFRGESDHAMLCRKSRIENGCLVWTAGIQGDGYGTIGGKRGLAHRFAYTLWVGPIPAGLTLDHLCRNRRCIWPEHLEAVTNRVNILRGVGATAQHARQTYCKWGHLLEGANLMRNVRGRQCLACHRTRTRVNMRSFRQRAKELETP